MLNREVKTRGVYLNTDWRAEARVAESDTNWVRLAPNGTNLGLFNLRSVSVQYNDLKKSQSCPIRPIRPTFEATLTSLILLVRQDPHHVMYAMTSRDA